MCLELVSKWGINQWETRWEEMFSLKRIAGLWNSLLKWLSTSKTDIYSFLDFRKMNETGVYTRKWSLISHYLIEWMSRHIGENGLLKLLSFMLSVGCKMVCIHTSWLQWSQLQHYIQSYKTMTNITSISVWCYTGKCDNTVLWILQLKLLFYMHISQLALGWLIPLI